MLIEGAQGVLALLEEQCLLGERGSDGGFCRSLAKKHEAHAHFRAPRMPRAPGEFVLQHYAGEVSYYGEGFLERNLDTLSGRLGELMASSAEPLLRALFREQRAELQPAATPRRRASTQGAQYPNPNPNPNPNPHP